MLLIQKLKSLEKQIIFIRWIDGEEYGKLQYVGNDYIEFTVINSDHEYDETLLLRPNTITEIIYGGTEINKIIAEVSSKLTIPDYN